MRATSRDHPQAETAALRPIADAAHMFAQKCNSPATLKQPGTKLKLVAPDDWHHHLRDGPALATTVPAAAKQFKRAIIMPNLVPPVTTTDAAVAYRQRIMDALHASGSPDTSFDPLMTLYLTDETPPEEVRRAAESGVIKAFKLYPAGATTNSASGVTDIEKCGPALQAMAEHGLLLCIHGEVTDPDVDIFDRERVFVATKLPRILELAPGLKVVLEHLTTKEAARFILDAGPNVAGTITPHHLLVNRNALLAGGIRPHYYCLPILKTEEDRLALIDAVRSGCDRIFLGSDSAPHAVDNKECACGSAGVYSAHAALELYAEAFEKAGILHLLEPFSAVNGPAFYGLPPNTEQIALEQAEWTVPASIPFAEGFVVPFLSGSKARWRLCTGASAP